MKYINNKYVLLSTILCTVLLAGCSSRPNTTSTGQNTGVQVDSGYIADTGSNIGTHLALIISGMASSKYLSGYTGDTVIITPENSGAVAIQPGDQLLYRNEVYGFQVLLGKEWKGGRICRIIGEGIGDSNAIISFSIKHPFNNMPVVEDIAKCIGHGGFEGHIQLNIYTHKNYIDYRKKPLELGSTETPRSIIQRQTYGKNNVYYFTLMQGVPDIRIQQLYPYIACKNLGKDGDYEIVSCPGRINQLFANKLSTFNIK